MKKLLIILIILNTILCKSQIIEFLGLSKTNDLDTIYIDVFFWQSNMNGFLNDTFLMENYSDYYGALPECQIYGALTSGEFQDAEAGINCRSTVGYYYQDAGPEIIELKNAADYYNKTIYGVKLAIGGTGIDSVSGSDWSPRSIGELYDTLFYNSNETSYLQLAYNILESQNKPIIIRAVYGCGGEEDAGNHSRDFHDDLTELIDSVRSHWNNDTIQFIFNQLHINSLPGGATVDDIDTVRASFQYVADNDPYVKLLNIDDKSLRDDNVHFTDSTIVYVGQQFFLLSIE